MPKIEVAIVMAGAVSAGSYTAGVLTRIFEILDDYYNLYNGNPPVDFALKEIGGASAGGVNAAIAAVNAKNKINSNEPSLVSVDNPFYDAWVSRINIEQLLQDSKSKDLDRLGISLLNSAHLDDLGDAILARRGKDNYSRPYITSDTRYLFTLTNLEGAGYEISFPPNAHMMKNHRDWISFSENEKMDFTFNLSSQADWNRLKDAALATAAFPFGLSARQVNIDIPDVRHYQDPLMFHESRSVTYKIPNPTLRLEEGQKQWFIDGGVINNEPFHLINKYLIDGANESSTLVTLMIDPFPEHKPKKPEDHENGRFLTHVGLQLLNAWKGTARFKPLAIDYNGKYKIPNRKNNNYGWLFSINPKRTKTTNGKGQAEFALASGRWGGFFGFFSKAFRHHDYLLGYKNADGMLLKHFYLTDTKNEEGKPLISSELKAALEVMHSHATNVDNQALNKREACRQNNPNRPIYLLPLDIRGEPLWKHPEKPLWPVQHYYTAPKRERASGITIGSVKLQARRNNIPEAVLALQLTQMKLKKRLKYFIKTLIKRETSLGPFFGIGLQLFANNKLIKTIMKSYEKQLNDMYEDR